MLEFAHIDIVIMGLFEHIAVMDRQAFAARPAQGKFAIVRNQNIDIERFQHFTQSNRPTVGTGYQYAFAFSFGDAQSFSHPRSGKTVGKNRRDNNGKTERDKRLGPRQSVVDKAYGKQTSNRDRDDTARATEPI